MCNSLKCQPFRLQKAQGEDPETMYPQSIQSVFSNPSLLLTELYLSNQKLRTLPNELKDLYPYLRILDVSFNKLSSLPNLNLYNLNISHNEFYIFPKIEVQVLDVKANPFILVHKINRLLELSMDWFMYVGWPDTIDTGRLDVYNEWLSYGDGTFKSFLCYFRKTIKKIDILGRTLIHIASCASHLGVIFSCHQYVDINAQDVKQQTALQLAMSQGKRRSVKCLIALGADYSIIDCIKKRDIKLLKLMLHHQRDQNEIDKDGNTCFHYLFLRWDEFTLRATKLLLYHNADANLKNKIGKTPLHVAIHNGNFLAIQFAQLHYNQFDFSIPFNDKSLLEMALMSNRYQIALNLIENSQIHITVRSDVHCIQKIIHKQNKIVQRSLINTTTIQTPRIQSARNMPISFEQQMPKNKSYFRVHPGDEFDQEDPIYLDSIKWRNISQQIQKTADQYYSEYMKSNNHQSHFLIILIKIMMQATLIYFKLFGIYRDDPYVLDKLRCIYNYESQIDEVSPIQNERNEELPDSEITTNIINEHLIILLRRSQLIEKPDTNSLNQYEFYQSFVFN